MACTQADKRKMRPKEKLIPILDDLDQSWTKREMRQAAMMYKNNVSLENMAKLLRPHDRLNNAVDEVALLIMHLGRQGMV